MELAFPAAIESHCANPQADSSAHTRVSHFALEKRKLFLAILLMQCCDHAASAINNTQIYIGFSIIFFPTVLAVYLFFSIFFSIFIYRRLILAACNNPVNKYLSKFTRY